MAALTMELPDETRRRLEVVARARGISVARLFDEMSSVMLAEAHAEMQFQLRARRGAEKDARGLALLERAVGHGRSGGPSAES